MTICDLTKFIRNELGIENYELMTNKIVDGVLLHMYLPENKVGIICHFDYYSSVQQGAKYNDRADESDKCIKAGIHPIHIWDREWIEKSDIIKHRLKNLLGKSEVIYARKCIVKEIDASTKNKFFTTYHIQGKDCSKVKLGLFYQDELIAVMTFGKPRFSKKYDYELIRFASKYRVIGGASKLYKYFERTYKPKSVVSYADRKWSKDGGLYKALGFELINVSGPNYVYYIPLEDNKYQVFPRYSAQKHKLSGLLGDMFDPNLTEVDNMLRAGFVQIYDCGNYVFGKFYE